MHVLWLPDAEPIFDAEPWQWLTVGSIFAFSLLDVPAKLELRMNAEKRNKLVSVAPSVLQECELPIVAVFSHAHVALPPFVPNCADFEHIELAETDIWHF